MTKDLLCGRYNIRIIHCAYYIVQPPALRATRLHIMMCRGSTRPVTRDTRPISTRHAVTLSATRIGAKKKKRKNFTVKGVLYKMRNQIFFGDFRVPKHHGRVQKL